MASQAPFRLPNISVQPRPARPLRHPLPPSDDMLRLGVTLRPETPDDIRFTHALYAETRAPEMLMMSATWDDDTKRDFVDKQYSYQYLHQSRYYGDADFAIIELNRRPIGRFYVHWGQGALRLCSLLEIQLVSDCRDRGIGSTLIAALLRRARETRYSVSLYVDRMNPARRLYTRFGFHPTGSTADNGSFEMRWSEGPVTPGIRLAD